MTTSAENTNRPTWATVAGISSAVLAVGLALYAIGLTGPGAILGMGVIIMGIGLFGLAGAASAYFFSRRA